MVSVIVILESISHRHLEMLEQKRWDTGHARLNRQKMEFSWLCLLILCLYSASAQLMEDLQ